MVLTLTRFHHHKLLDQFHLPHTPTAYIPKTHLHAIFSSRCTPFKWIFLKRFLRQTMQAYVYLLSLVEVTHPPTTPLRLAILTTQSVIDENINLFFGPI
jgi:hypothetical protein